MKAICVISARAGSKGVKSKNILNFFSKPLIAWSIIQAIKSKKFLGVFVSTDSKKIAQISKRYGAQVTFIRSKKLSGNYVPKFFVWKDALKRIENYLNTKVDYFVDLDCTNPLRSINDIGKALNLLARNKNTDAVISTCESKKNPYMNMVEKKGGLLKISKISKNKKVPVSRQLAPKVYDVVANIYCLRRKFLKEKKAIFEGKIKGYEMDRFKSLDIDSQEDLEIVTHRFKTKILKK